MAKLKYKKVSEESGSVKMDPRVIDAKGECGVVGRGIVRGKGWGSVENSEKGKERSGKKASWESCGEKSKGK